MICHKFKISSTILLIYEFVREHSGGLNRVESLEWCAVNLKFHPPYYWSMNLFENTIYGGLNRVESFKWCAVNLKFHPPYYWFMNLFENTQVDKCYPPYYWFLRFLRMSCTKKKKNSWVKDTNFFIYILKKLLAPINICLNLLIMITSHPTVSTHFHTIYKM